MFGHVIFFMLLKMINADNGAVLSMCKNNKQLYCTIANDSSSSAISWDTPTKEVSYKYYNITENNALQNSNWTLRKTLKDTFGFEPVLDYRWEGFPTQKCVFPLGEKVELSASVQGKKMILLCKTVEGNNCVKVVFGPGGPFESNDNEQKNCFDHSKTPRDTNWSHFTLISNSTSVYIRQYNSSKVLQVPKTYSKLLVINSKWKLHSFDVYSSEKPRTSVLQIKNDFSETGDICLGLLCYAYGTLKLTLSDSNRVLSAVNNTKEGEWEEIQLCGYIPFNTSMTLEIDTITESKSSKFYIADIIRKFNENDNVRILTKNNPKNQCCQAIKLSKKICTENLTYSRYTSGYSNCSLNSSYTGMWNIQSRNLMPASFIELSANVTGTSAIISWNISSTVVYNGSYEIKCRNINSSEESEETRRIDLTNSNFVELSDLEPNSTYLIMILENADHQLGNITITISGK
ncbi:Fibronectin type III domain [Popillia japonica]|uniref:Fibronectin type III domain n=1 Tax=Popillia japonica TaxID=7064 RepID=A0AAW1L361_POPJA